MQRIKVEHIGTVRNSGSPPRPSDKAEVVAVVEDNENTKQAYSNVDLNKQSQPDFDENKSSQTNVYANFHYKSQGSQMRAAPFNYPKN